MFLFGDCKKEVASPCPLQGRGFLAWRKQRIFGRLIDIINTIKTLCKVRHNFFEKNIFNLSLNVYLCNPKIRE
jgi:hypothetical protein